MRFHKLLPLLCCLFWIPQLLAAAPQAVCLGVLFGVTTESALRSNRCIATVQYLVAEAAKKYPNISWGVHDSMEMVDTHGFAYRSAQLALKQAVTPCANGAPLSLVIGNTDDETFIAAATVLGPLGVSLISPMSRTPASSDRRLYPRAFRTSTPFAREAEALFQLMRQHDWNKVAVIYSQDNAGSMIANLVPKLATEAGVMMDILEQALPPTDGGDGALRIVTNLRNLRYRVILIHATETTAKLVVSSMHKAGMLNGDFIILGTTYWTSSAVGDQWVAFDNDEKEWLKGAIGVAFYKPSGAAWSSFLGNITAFAPDYFYPVHDEEAVLPVKNTHDAATLAINSAAYLWRRGIAITPDSMYQRVLQNTEFKGVTGRVYIDENGDSFPEISITNFQNGEFKVVGGYSVPQGATAAVLEMTAPIVWPDGSVGGKPKDDVPRHLMEVPSWAINLGYVILALGILVNLTLHHLIHKERAHEVIKASSPIFCHLIVAGSAFTYLIPGLGSISPDVLCRALPGCVAAAFSIIFGSLFAKTWRIHRIFNSRTLTRKAPTNKNLLTVVASLLGLEALVQIIWMSSDLPQVKLVNHPTDAFASVHVCGANHMDAWWTLSLLFKAVAILFGLYFAYKVRKLNHNFNEAKYISLAVYNVLFISVLLLPLALLFETNPTASYIIRTLGPAVGAIITLALLFVPKFWDMYITHDWVEYVSDAIYENGVLVHKSSKHSHNSNGSFNNTNSAQGAHQPHRLGGAHHPSHQHQNLSNSVTKPVTRTGGYMATPNTHSHTHTRDVNMRRDSGNRQPPPMQVHRTGSQETSMTKHARGPSVTPPNKSPTAEGPSVVFAVNTLVNALETSPTAAEDSVTTQPGVISPSVSSQAALGVVSPASTNATL